MAPEIILHLYKALLEGKVERPTALRWTHRSYAVKVTFCRRYRRIVYFLLGDCKDISIFRDHYTPPTETHTVFGVTYGKCGHCTVWHEPELSVATEATNKIRRHR